MMKSLLSQGGDTRSLRDRARGPGSRCAQPRANALSSQRDGEKGTGPAEQKRVRPLGNFRVSLARVGSLADLGRWAGQCAKHAGEITFRKNNTIYRAFLNAPSKPINP